MLLKHEIRVEMFVSSGSCCIRDSTSSVKKDQTTSLRRHLAFLGMTGWYLIRWLMTMAIDRWSELQIGSAASVYNVFVDQLRPQSNTTYHLEKFL